MHAILNGVGRCVMTSDCTLDLQEFILAMHLTIARVKGQGGHHAARHAAARAAAS